MLWVNTALVIAIWKPLTLNDGSITMTNKEVQNIDINHLQAPAVS